MSLQQCLTEQFGGASVQKEDEIGAMLADSDSRAAGLELWAVRQTGLLLGPGRDEEFTLHVNQYVPDDELKVAAREFYEREGWVFDKDDFGLRFRQEERWLCVTTSNFSSEIHPCIMVTVSSGDY